MFLRAPAGEPTDPDREAGGDMLPARGARLVQMTGDENWLAIAWERDQEKCDWSAHKADTVAITIPGGTAS